MSRTTRILSWTALAVMLAATISSARAEALFTLLE